MPNLEFAKTMLKNKDDKIGDLITERMPSTANFTESVLNKVPLPSKNAAATSNAIPDLSSGKSGLPAVMPPELPDAIPVLPGGIPTSPAAFIDELTKKMPTVESIKASLNIGTGPEMRNVDVNKNSDILGNKLRAKFKEFMEKNGLEKVIGKALTGFKSYFDEEILMKGKSVPNSSYEYMTKCVGAAIQQILIIFVTLSVNTKEHDFKTELFQAVLKKIPTNFSYTNTPRYIKKKDNQKDLVEPSQYYKTLMANIGQKMVNILKTYRGVRGGKSIISPKGEGLRERRNASAFGSSSEFRRIQQLGGSANNDDSPDMDCFLNNRSAQIIREFFEYNVSSKDILESISTELVNMLFAIYNDQDVRKKVCGEIIDPIVKILMESAIKDIIELLCREKAVKKNTSESDNTRVNNNATENNSLNVDEIQLDMNSPHQILDAKITPLTPSSMDGGGNPQTIQLPLETLYVLLDDPNIQRIIQKAKYDIADDAKKLSNAFSHKSKEKDPAKEVAEAKEVDTHFNNIIKILQKPEFSKKPVEKDWLDKIIDRLSRKKSSISTPNDAKQVVQGGGDEKIHIGPSDYNIMSIISTIVSETMEDISNQLGDKLKKKDIQDIIVAFFNNKKNQNIFLTDEQMNDVYNNIYRCLFETFTDTFRLHVFYVNNMYTKTLVIDSAGTIDPDNAREQYVQSDDPEWIINIVKNLSIEATYKEEAPDLIKNVENPNTSNHEMIQAENTTNETNTNMSSNAEEKQQFNISYEQELDATGHLVPANHTQINSIISNIMLQHFISAFNDNETHEKIEQITTEILREKMANISGEEYKTQHPPFSLLLQNCFQKPKEQKNIFENPDTNVIQLVKKVLRNSLLGFHNIPLTDKDNTILSKKEECIRFAVFCYLSDYLYTGSETSKVNRPLNLGALHFQSKYSIFLGYAYKNILSGEFIHVFQEGNSDDTVTTYLTNYSTNLVKSNSNFAYAEKQATRLNDERKEAFTKTGEVLTKTKKEAVTKAKEAFTKTGHAFMGKINKFNPFAKTPKSSGGKYTKRRYNPHTKRRTRKRKTEV